MIFEEKSAEEFKKEGGVRVLTWDKANATLLGDLKDFDVKSVKLEIEAGGIASVLVEIYDTSVPFKQGMKRFPPITEKKFIVGFDQDNLLRIPIIRVSDEEKDPNQLEFNF
jgi:hypothetical protein